MTRTINALPGQGKCNQNFSGCFGISEEKEARSKEQSLDGKTCMENSVWNPNCVV